MHEMCGRKLFRTGDFELREARVLNINMPRPGGKRDGISNTEYLRNKKTFQFSLSVERQAVRILETKSLSDSCRWSISQCRNLLHLIYYRLVYLCSLVQIARPTQERLTCENIFYY